MSENIKISVIVPVYNTSKYLEKCLNSLINQTLKDIEIICVDDGSDDNSLDILKEFAQKDARIVVLTQKNCGQSVARNVGMKLASGEYIGFLDSDDWADSEMLEKLYNNAEIYKTDITMCSISVFDEKTGLLNTSDPYMTLDLFPNNLEETSFTYKDVIDFIFRICVVPWNKIYKRQFLFSNKISFPEGLFFEDNVFCTEALIKAKSISIIKSPLVFYRRFSEVSTTTGNDVKKLDFFEVFKLIEIILNKNKMEELKDYFFEYKKNTLIYWYRKLNDSEVKEEYLKKLLYLYPDLII